MGLFLESYFLVTLFLKTAASALFLLAFKAVIRERTFYPYFFISFSGMSYFIFYKASFIQIGCEKNERYNIYPAFLSRKDGGLRIALLSYLLTVINEAKALVRRSIGIAVRLAFRGEV